MSLGLVQTYLDISNNVLSYNNAIAQFKSDKESPLVPNHWKITTDRVYDNNDYFDKDGFPKDRPTLADGLQSDAYTMVITHNNMYMLGIIATATLLIGAILVGKSQQ